MSEVRLTRRAILRGGSLFIAGAGVGTLVWPGCSHSRGGSGRRTEPLRIGVLTDVHYADKVAHGSRHYRESLSRVAAAVERFNDARTDFAIQLGDFIDSADSLDQELGHLRTIEAVYAQARCPRHHVLGNHCVHTLTKAQFLETVAAKASYYSFDAGGFHFVVLDGCFRSDGQAYGNRNSDWTDANIPSQQCEWLAADLRSARKPTIVFVHQRLDVDGHYGIKNQMEVRRLLEQAGIVQAVFQGHQHQNDLNEIGGIHYCTLAAMVEGPEGTPSSFGLLTVNPDGTLRIDGYGGQQSHEAPALSGSTL